MKWKAQCRVDGITPISPGFLRCRLHHNVLRRQQRLSEVARPDKQKNQHRQVTKESIKLLKKNGIECRLYMIIGLFGEPDDIVRADMGIHQRNFARFGLFMCLLTVRPGTRMYEKPEEFDSNA